MRRPPTHNTSNAISNVPTGGVALNWNDTANCETSFVIQRSVDDINFTQVGNTGTDVSSFIDPTAEQDSVYYYRVLAVNGSADSGYSNTVRVDTTGVKITVATTQKDPAGNPEIWYDDSVPLGSDGFPETPTGSDPNLVPVVVDVPLGEDDFGTATLTWSSAIRLFKPDDDGGVGVTTFSPVGTLESGPYGSYYTLTWDVTQKPQSQMFYAQGVAGSLNLGDQSLNLSAALFLYDPATDPPVNQQTTPATTQPVTGGNIAISSNISSTDVVIGQKEKLTATLRTWSLITSRFYRVGARRGSSTSGGYRRR